MITPRKMRRACPDHQCRGGGQHGDHHRSITGIAPDDLATAVDAGAARHQSGERQRTTRTCVPIEPRNRLKELSGAPIPRSATASLPVHWVLPKHSRDPLAIPRSRGVSCCSAAALPARCPEGRRPQGTQPLWAERVEAVRFLGSPGSPRRTSATHPDVSARTPRVLRSLRDLAADVVGRSPHLRSANARLMSSAGDGACCDQRFSVAISRGPMRVKCQPPLWCHSQIGRPKNSNAGRRSHRPSDSDTAAHVASRQRSQHSSSATLAHLRPGSGSRSTHK